MKTTALVTALTLVLIGTAVGQTVSPTDKVLFDRATAFVKGLRDGKSWNKTIAELKKDFPDMKELEPFRAIEGSEIFAREFGALYSFDTATMRQVANVQCSDFPQMRFSFYNDKLYRAEIFYQEGENTKASQIISSFFKGTEIVRVGRIKPNGIWTENVRARNMVENDFTEKYPCKYVLSRERSVFMYGCVLTHTPTEKQFYNDQNLLHPDWGYANVKWNSSSREVASVYKDLVERSYDDSIYGLRDFVQENKSGDIKEREFRFFQDSLFEVRIEYGKNQAAATSKILLMYREDASIESRSGDFIGYFNPRRPYIGIKEIIYQRKMKEHGERKKQAISNADL